MSVTYVHAHGDDGRAHIACAECGHHYGPLGRDPRLSAIATEQPRRELTGNASKDGVSRLVERRYYCPSCALLLAAGVCVAGAPLGSEHALAGRVANVAQSTAAAAAQCT